MEIDIDLPTMDISFEGFDTISFDGHSLYYGGEEGLVLWCPECDEAHSLDHNFNGLHRWEATLYLLGHFEESCEDSQKSIDKRIEEKMMPHLGKPIDVDRLHKIKREFRDIFPERSSFNLST